MPNLPTANPEIDAFLRAFETCTLPRSEWTHAAHLFTGACYVHAHGELEATAKMRANVSRYNLAAGGQNTETSGYHETITIAWIKLLASLRTHAAHLTRPEFAALAVAHFAPQPEIFRRHYDFDLLASREARARWIEPNLAPLEIPRPTLID
jgi:hypothetical protein